MTFKIGDRVEKWTGDYCAEGEVRAVYTTHEGGPVRYMVALDRITRGRIMHTLGEAQLRPVASPIEALAARARRADTGAMRPPRPTPGLRRLAWRAGLILALIFLVCLAITLRAHAAEPQTAPVRQLWVIDGDTIDVPRPEDPGRRERLRIEAIDAPETHRATCESERRAGLAAKAEAIRIVRAGRQATITRAGLDRYGRRLGSIAIDGRDLGAALVASGHALPYQPGAPAKAARIGHWCGGAR